MSHDRGCFRCHDDPPYTYCRDANCPKNDRGVYSPEAIEAAARVRREQREAEELARRCSALNFWRDCPV